VRPIEIDTICPEALQALLDGSDHVLAAVSRARKPAILLCAEGVLRGDDEVIPVGGDELTDHLFGLPDLIGIGGVDEVTARRDVSVEHALRFLALGAVTPAGAEVAGPQRKLRYA
jgi:hypothetical protein